MLYNVNVSSNGTSKKTNKSISKQPKPQQPQPTMTGMLSLTQILSQNVSNNQHKITPVPSPTTNNNNTTIASNNNNNNNNNYNNSTPTSMQNE